VVITPPPPGVRPGARYPGFRADAMRAATQYAHTPWVYSCIAFQAGPMEIGHRPAGRLIDERNDPRTGCCPDRLIDPSNHNLTCGQTAKEGAIHSICFAPPAW